MDPKTLMRLDIEFSSSTAASRRAMSEKSAIIVKISPENAPPAISQKAHLERLIERTFRPETSGKMDNAAPRDAGTNTTHIPIKTSDVCIPVSSLVPVR